MNKTYNDLINFLTTYMSKDELKIVDKAYRWAEKLHENQKRLSGEPYIIHPINVAYILAIRNADVETICAALLHDIVEDAKVTIEEIIQKFNSTVAYLVDGVSKIKALPFTTKEEIAAYNFASFMKALSLDVRIAFIKLADRLHNMRTLEFKNSLKQEKISLETLSDYVPLAEHLGDYRFKKELEDLALKFLKPGEYNNISLKRENVIAKTQLDMNALDSNIRRLLNGDPFIETKHKCKNIFGMYYLLQEKKLNLEEIHDLLVLEVLTEEVNDCYNILNTVNSEYKLYPHSQKDYIEVPKTNGYRSLHTTLYVPRVDNEGVRLIQAQIRTKEMSLFASFGLAAYWRFSKSSAQEQMQQHFESQGFYSSLQELSKMYTKDSWNFAASVHNDLLKANVYVLTTAGEIIELPIGSTSIDFAYKIHTQIGDYIKEAIVNGQSVDFSTPLQTGDTIQIITSNELAELDEATTKTAYARKKVRELNNKKVS